MTLLAPAALIGLGLLAIPIVVHLFKPRRVRQTPFSSLRWLHLTQQRMARRIQWHQVLLFLLRASFLTLLVLALARPLWSPRGASGARDRVYVIDVSRSMGRSLEGRPRPIESARQLAAEALRAMQPGDRAAVLLVGPTTAVLSPWTPDAASILPALETLEPGSGGTNLDSSLEPIYGLLALRRSGASAEVTILTDNTSGSWTPGAIASFLEDPSPGLDANPAKSSNEDVRFGASVRLIDVSLPAPQNGWLSAARLKETEVGPVLRVEAACVGDSPQSRTLTVKGLSGVEPLTTPMKLEPGRRTTLDLPLPATFVRKGSQARLRLDPPDELPDDDEWFADLDATGSLRILLIEPESPGGDSQRAGFVLRTAIESLADASAVIGDVSVSLQTPAALAAAEIESADVIVLCDVPGLSAAQSEALTQRVSRGAGAAIFLGPRVEPDVFNERFVQPLRPAEGLLPVRLGPAVSASPASGGLETWGRWNDRHPLVAGLLDPLVGDLPQTRSKQWLRTIDEWPAENVVARFSDGTPALAVHTCGAGRVVLFNATADDRWSDLPRRKSYLPVVDRTLAYLAGPGRSRSFAAGEPIALTLPASFGESVVIRSPSGKAVTPRVEATDAGTTLHLEGLTESGFYRVDSTPGESRAADGSAGSLTFVVQPDRADSSLAPMDAETLRSWWSPVPLEIVKSSAASTATALTDDRRALDPFLLIAACVVLLAEMFLVHWLCPRVNPALAASPARRRGFVAPLREREDVAP